MAKANVRRTCAISVMSCMATGAAAQQAAPPVDEIIVTAQFRAADVQYTPISISVLDGEALQVANKTGTEDILRDLPGVDVRRAPAGAFINIRGVTSMQGGGEVDPGISFNVDGVYNPFQESSFLAFVDLDRVEVLRGPQGTLYGRNAIAGTINVITRSPQLDEYGGYVIGGLGSHDARDFTGVLNVPLSETVAARFVGNHKYNSGYLDTGSDDIDSVAGRAKVLWVPGSNFQLEFSGDYGKYSGQGNAPAVFPLQDDPWTGYPTPETPYQDIWQWGASIQADWDLGAGTLTYIPAYKKKENDTATDGGNVFIRTYVYDSQHTQELRFTSNATSPMSWLAGAYYFRGVNDKGLTFAATITQHVVTTSYAAFGQGTYSVNDRVRLTGGIRYTRDRKVEEGTNRFGDTIVSQIDGIDFSWNEWTWRAAIEYDLIRDSMFYASVATGFKAGGVSLVAGSNAAFDPEQLTAYEVGIRNRFLDRRLTLNATLFFSDYENYQAIFVAPNPDFGNAMVRRIANAGDSEIYGAEIQVMFLPTPASRISATIAHLKGEFGDYIVPTPAPGVFNDYSGSEISMPPWTASVGYSHEINLRGGARITPQVSVRYSSDVYRDARQYANAGAWGPAGTYVNPFSLQDSFMTGEFNLTYAPFGDRYRVTAYVKNVTNKVVRTGTGGTPGVNGNAFLEPPRTYGMTAQFNW
jgi:iron complex outermembrane recepter protein